MSDTQFFAIGTLGVLTATKVNTIRFYESIGLLPEPSRSPSGRRVYCREDVQRLSFIRHCRGFGFSVEAVRELLAITSDRAHTCEAVTSMARSFLDELDRKLTTLQTVRDDLNAMIDRCAGGRVADCTIIAELAAPTRSASHSARQQ